MNNIQDLNGEIWKDIPGYEGRYQVSNMGRVKSLDRITIDKHGRNKRLKGQIIAPKKGTVKGHDYVNVIIYKDLRDKTFRIHVAVMLAFVGERPENHVIDHINGDGLDNRLVNLRYCTKRENAIFDNVKRKKTHSKYLGVTRTSWNEKRWMAHIRINAKQYNLGSFENEIDAHNAYVAAAKKSSPGDYFNSMFDTV